MVVRVIDGDRGAEEPTFPLGYRLRRSRELAGIKTHEEMASRLTAAGYTIKRGAVSNWERDVNTLIDPGMLVAWSKVTGVSLAWLLEGLEGMLQTSRGLTNRESLEPYADAG